MVQRIERLIKIIQEKGIAFLTAHIEKKIKSNLLCIKEFGVGFYLKRIFFFKTHQYDKYIQLIYQYLCVESSEIINNYKNKKIVSTFDQEDKKKIWVCWWQGFDQMPELCKMCFRQLNRVLDEKKFELVLVTKDNFSLFAKIPANIIEKMQNGIIELTQFSDVLRQALISQNGGVWLDSTIWCEEEANDFFSINADFWSVKLDCIDDKRVLGQLISNCNWSGFIINGYKNSLACSFVFEAMCNYYKKHNFVVDYFYQNLFIKMAYENIESIKQVIDSMEASNFAIYDLFKIMNCPYNEDVWKNLTLNSSIFKLTQKHEYMLKINNSETFYSALLFKSSNK